MFGDLLGNLEKQQEEMKKKLMSVEVETKVEGVFIKGNAAKMVTNIEIDSDFLQTADKEMLEDMLVIAVNRFIEEAVKIEADQAGKMMNDMLPKGFEGLFK